MATTASAATSAMGFFASSPLVARRENRLQRRRQRKATSSRKSIGRVVRQGFVFEEPQPRDEKSDKARRSAKRGARQSSQMFVFRARHMDKDDELEKGARQDRRAETAAAATAQKKEKAAKQHLRRQRLQQKKAEMEAEEKYEQSVEGQLSHDQMRLFRIVRDQVKRELRRARKEFETTSTRADMLQLTETSLQAIRQEFTTFMIQNPPSNSEVTVPNPENARLKALVKSYESRIQTLDEEEQEWKSMVTAMDADQTDVTMLDTEHRGVEQSVHSMGEQTRQVDYELQLAREVEDLQKEALSKVETSAHRLTVIEDSMKSVDRLILQAEVKNSNLFDAFHGSAFRGYVNIAEPKETLRALLKLAPRSHSS